MNRPISKPDARTLYKRTGQAANPCPHCQSTDVDFWRIVDLGDPDGYAYCKDCFAHGPECDGPKSALVAWNAGQIHPDL